MKETIGIFTVQLKETTDGGFKVSVHEKVYSKNELRELLEYSNEQESEACGEYSLLVRIIKLTYKYI